jgi:hypothetical protein
MLAKLRQGLKFVLMSVGISTPEKKTGPATKPFSKSKP